MKSDRVLAPLLAVLAWGTVWAGVNEWTNVGPEGGSALCLAVDSQDPATVYAGTSSGLFKNTVYAGGPGGLFAISLDPEGEGTRRAFLDGRRTRAPH